MAPYFCHIHNGLYVYADGLDGCQEDSCVRFRSLEVPPDIRRMANPDVPGGYNEKHRDATYKMKKDFEPGINAYRKAKAEGIQPDGTTTKKVEEAYDRVRTHQRAVDKLKKTGTDVSSLKSVAGVEK